MSKTYGDLAKRGDEERFFAAIHGTDDAVADGAMIDLLEGYEVPLPHYTDGITAVEVGSNHL